MLEALRQEETERTYKIENVLHLPGSQPYNKGVPAEAAIQVDVFDHMHTSLLHDAVWKGLHTGERIRPSSASSQGEVSSDLTPH